MTTRRQKISVLEKVRERKNPRLFQTKQQEDRDHAAFMANVKTVSAGNLSEITPYAGRLLAGAQAIEITANQMVVRPLNYYLVYSNAETQMIPDVAIPFGGLSINNIIRVMIRGKLYNNSGGAVNITPKIYTGQDGSETQVSAAVAYSVAAGTTERGFVYSFSLQGSPFGGTYVLVDEQFELESSSDVVGFLRSTTTQVGTITSLDNADNLYVSFTLATAHAAIKLWTNSVTVELLEGTRDEGTEYRFFSTSFEDTLIQDNNPTTNYGTNTQLNIGESNAAVSINRSLIRCTNLTDIPSNAEVIQILLYLYITADAASNIADLRMSPAANDWTEAGATWNTYDGTHAWTGSGANGHFNSGSEYPNTGLTASEPVGKIIVWDITSDASKAYMQTAIGGGANPGWVMKTNGESQDMYQFGSSENTTVYAVPVLEVVYRLP